MHDSSSIAAADPAAAFLETGRRLWYRMAVLAVVGVISLAVLVSQVIDARSEAGKGVAAELDRSVQEIEAVKRQLMTLGGEVAASKARRSELAEQIIGSDKEAKRLESEVSALKVQRAALVAKLEELGRSRQETERLAGEAAQYRTEVETELTAARAQLAELQARNTAAVAAVAAASVAAAAPAVKRTRHRAPKPAKPGQPHPVQAQPGQPLQQKP
ncbi:MAG: hypothetical protein WCF85_10335 [Rhodospirillaceae bacterium]